MISLVLGPVVGVSALAAALADFVILGEAHGQLFLSSPLETEETASGEMTNEEVGGAQCMRPDPVSVASRPVMKMMPWKSRLNCSRSSPIIVEQALHTSTQETLTTETVPNS